MKELIFIDQPNAHPRGFGAVERSENSAWRWALGSRQRVELALAPGSLVFFRFSVPAGLGESEITVSLNGAEQARFRAGESRVCEGCLLLSAGEQTVEIAASRTNETHRFCGDARALAYVVEKFAALEPARFYREMKMVMEVAGTGARTPLTFDIAPTPVAQRWASLLEKILRSEMMLVKHFAFLGWPSTGRDLPFLCAEMNRHIATINDFFRAHPALPHVIDMEFRAQDLEGQHAFNRIHAHFEKLIGQAWQLSPYYEAADSRTKHAIFQLNHLCHEMEGLREVASGAQLEIPVTIWPPYQREPLFTAEYPEFSLDLEWGDVFAHYAQPGKSHLQAFRHDDEIVGDHFVNGLRFLSGEFDVHLSPPRSAEARAAERARFRRWLIERDVNPDDPRHGLGYLVVAKLRRSELPERPILEHVEEFRRSWNNIREIRLTRADGESVARVYGDHWRDPDYEAREIAAL